MVNIQAVVLSLALFLGAFGSYASSHATSVSGHKVASHLLPLYFSIKRLEPRTNEKNIKELAQAIDAASKKYEIDSTLLVAMIHQESSFRFNLPLGAAGETGVAQIRKMWLVQPSFIREFGKRTLSELQSVKFNVEVAAWLLSCLKKRRDIQKKNKPYWTFYNSTHPDAQQRYFLKIESKLQSIGFLKNKKTFRNFTPIDLKQTRLQRLPWLEKKLNSMREKIFSPTSSS